jgi:hypothetical protein
MTLGFLFAPFAPSHWKPELKSAILFSQGQKIKASSLLLLDESSSISEDLQVPCSGACFTGLVELNMTVRVCWINYFCF